MGKKDNILIIVLFGAFLTVISLGSLFLADRDFSDNENRTLEQMPKLTLESVLSGQFEKQFEKYENDQIIGRDRWISIKTGVKIVTGGRDIQGVYLGKDGYLLEKLNEEDIDQEQLKKNLMAIKKFYDRLPSKINKRVMAVPPAGHVLTDKLPQYATMVDGEKLGQKAAEILGKTQYVKIGEDLKQVGQTKDVFYKTDHHWTTRGAQTAFERYMETIGIPTNYRGEWMEVSDSFQGTHFSKILWDKGKDKVEIYQPERNSSIVAKADGKPMDGIFQEEFLKKKDKYAVFFGGNYGRLEMTGGPSNGRKLLLIKDSYANSFAPFAIDHFQGVAMVDLRYFRGELEKYVEEQRITHILVLYSMTNIASDKNIQTLGQKGSILR